MSAAATPVSSPPDPSAPERILGDDGGRAYRRFLAWTVGDGFAMAVIEVRSAAQRRELLAWTAQEMPGTHVVALDQASGKPLWPLLEQACPSPGGTDILVLTRLEDAVDRIKLCARINIQRDELVRAFPVPWVVLVHPAAALEMQQHAPDFSDFAGLWLNEEREHGLEHLEAVEQLGLASTFAAPTLQLSAEEGSSGLLERAYNAIVLSKYDEAADLIAQYDMRHPEARTREPLRMQLAALLLWLRGQPAEALSRLEEARRLCDPAANRKEHATILGDIARIRAQKGEVDAALALHNEALLVYEELGDPDGVAITRWSMGRIALRQGDWNAALEHLLASHAISTQLGHLTAICIVGIDLARLFLATGHKTKAIPILMRSRDGFLRLGRPDFAQQIQKLLDAATDDS